MFFRTKLDMFRLRPDIPFTLNDNKGSPYWTRSLPQHMPQPGCPISLNFIPDATDSVICVGSPNDSRGTILSGYISLTTSLPAIIKRLTANIVMTETLSHPAIHGCEDCTTRNTIINTEEIRLGEMPLSPGFHSYPLGFHIPGNLPASYTDKYRRVEYSLRIEAERPSPETIQYKKEFTIHRLCPRDPDSRLVRGLSPCFIATARIPRYTYSDEEFTIELELRRRSPKEKGVPEIWETKRITWEIVEIVEDIRLPCKKHSELFRSQNQGTIKERHDTIFSDELEFDREVFLPRPSTKKFEEYTLPCHIGRAITDVSTPNGYRVYHELRVRVFYVYLDPPLTGNESKREMEDHYRTRWFGMGIKLYLYEKSHSEEDGADSWDEEVAPAYPNIGDSPPPMLEEGSD
ncbi:hypothetical protein H072_8286 [Dactylellina haptotyla CBS 200.50]|uniref:LDB19 N-terminal domain-containing protein n=1 Tax=Dactylellina haptotyla (strain CBS 200.50) TaxID=1284197 RepID=S8A4T9_DACHA|nr:hypothetical protein H072_8286 [Dactylellina haptotyla CBS 200.50]